MRYVIDAQSQMIKASPSALSAGGVLIVRRLVTLMWASLCLWSGAALADESSPKGGAQQEAEGAALAADQAAKANGAEGGAQEGKEAKGDQEAEEPKADKKAQPKEADEAPLKSDVKMGVGPVKKRPVKRAAKAKKTKAKKKKRRRRYPTNRPKRPLKPAPKLGRIPFPLGERLVYKVNLLNAHSGTVTLKVGQRGTYQGKKVVELSGFIQSSPFLENFYPIRDSLSVLVDEVTFFPLKSNFFFNEKGREITFMSQYDPETNAIDWKQKKIVKGKPVMHAAKHMPPTRIYESLSSLYALRRLPLAPGLEFEQYVWDGKRERLIGVKVLGEERVLTELGWFETYKVELTSVITGGIIFSRRLLNQPPVKGTAWVAKDAYRTPVKLITPTRLGQAEAVLSQRGLDAPK